MCSVPVEERSAPSETRDYYDAYWSDPVQPRYELDDALSGLLAEHVDSATRCLDFGCGAGGTYAQWISRKTASYQGVDVSSKAIELATGNGLNARLIDDA